jgi:hypothetical protein
MKTIPLPTTAGLWWVTVAMPPSGKAQRKLVCVFENKADGGLFAEPKKGYIWPVVHGSFSDWQKHGRPPAKKGTKAEHQIHLRVSARRKRAYKKAAGSANLTNWIFSVCDRASGFNAKAK